MNIFVLDKCPKRSAELQIEWAGHYSYKPLILESAQMASTALRYRGLDDSRLYKKTHAEHRCNVWVRQTRCNFNWLLTYALHGCDLYTKISGKQHKSRRVLELAKSLQGHIPRGALTLPALAVSSSEAGRKALIDIPRTGDGDQGWAQTIQIYLRFYDAKHYVQIPKQIRRKLGLSKLRNG